MIEYLLKICFEQTTIVHKFNPIYIIIVKTVQYTFKGGGGGGGG